jgi:hypothetical protein
MRSVIRSLSLGLAAAVVLVHTAAAQEPAQVLKDAWVATGANLFEVDPAGPGGLTLRNAGDAPGRFFKAIAFEAPTLGSAVDATRGLIAVSGTEIWRYQNGTVTPELPPEELLDAAQFIAGGVPSSLLSVTVVAVTDKAPATILFSGYSKPKRVYELYELQLASGTVTMVATGTPQLTDAVYVRAADTVAGQFAGGGLLATAGKEVLFFRRNAGYAQTVLSLSLGLKGNAQLTSVDLIPQTNTLMLATSDRKLLTKAVDSSMLPTAFGSILPRTLACGALKTQRFLVRSEQGGDTSSVVVTDAACRQLLRYTFSSPLSSNNPQSLVATSSADLVALALGEGDSVTCTVEQQPCSLITGAFDAFIDVDETSELLVLQFPDLCDARVDDGLCPVQPGTDPIDDDDNLILNELLPPAVKAALGSAVIKIPPYLFGAGWGGRFGVVFVQADGVAADASSVIELHIDELAGAELGVDVDLARPTTILDLLNQDVAAYAPDNGAFKTVRDFEATPITVGMRNPMVGALRGFSAIIYGLQHDVNPPSLRVFNGVGIPLGTTITGAPPAAESCRLQHGSQVFAPHASDPNKYFVNLAACLFADEEELLRNVIPQSAITTQRRDSLLASLGQVEDKLIKALSGSGPNTGSETFQALLTQLDQFDAALAATPFSASGEIYKNELRVRSQVFRFNVQERTYPSLPTRGF